MSGRENDPSIRVDLPSPHLLIALASVEKKSEWGRQGAENPQLASREKDSESPVDDKLSPKVSPTPPPDVVDLLCTRAVREVEGLRLMDAAQKEYIDSLQKQTKASNDVIRQQGDLLKSYTDQVHDLKLEVADLKTVHENDEKEKVNLKKEIAILEKNKCGLICKAKLVVTGIGVGAVFVLLAL